MSAGQIRWRLPSSHGGYDLLRRRDLTAEEQDRVEDAAVVLTEVDGWLGDSPARNIAIDLCETISGVASWGGQGTAPGARDKYVRTLLERELVAQRLVAVRLRDLNAAPLAPSTQTAVAAPASASSTTWFSLKVLDEVGDPIDGIDIAYSVGGDRRVLQTNGAGVARLDPVDAGSFASAGLASLAAVRQKLKPRWRTPREPKIPTGDRVVARELGDPFETTSLEAEKPATLVLLPYFKCNEIAGTCFAFGRSFPRSDALQALAAIAQALSNDDGRKGMIFGHTDISGSEALDKELSERRARAIYALLTHDSAAWEELYSGSADGSSWKEKWDLEELQHILTSLGVTDDGGATPAENGLLDDATKQAIRRFEARNYPDCPAEQASLPASDTLDAAGRKELFLAYAKRVSRKPVNATRISNVGSETFMGCGEYNPLGLTVHDAESRRAVVFVYDPAAEPQSLPCQLRSVAPCQSNCRPLATTPDPNGKPPYRCKVYRAVADKCPCQPGPDVTHDLLVHVPVTLSEAQAMPHVFVLEGDDGTVRCEKRLASAARALDDFTCELQFTLLPEIHRYRLVCRNNGQDTELLPYTPYNDIPNVISNPNIGDVERVNEMFSAMKASDTIFRNLSQQAGP